MIKKESQQEDIISIDDMITNNLFILPVNGNPIFPGSMLPISISSKELVNALEKIEPSLDYLGIVAIKKESISEPDYKSIYSVGTLVKVIKKLRLPDGSINLLINTLKRFQIKKFINKKTYQLYAQVEYINEPRLESYSEAEQVQIKALSRAILNSLKSLAHSNPFMMEQIKLTLANIDGPSKIGDFSITLIKLEPKEYQKILKTFNLKERLTYIFQYLEKEVKIIEFQHSIQKQTDQEIQQKQRNFFLREQLKAIQKELGTEGEQQKNQQFENKIQKMKISNDSKKQLLKELNKLSNTDTHSPEYSILYNYMDTVCTLPWNILNKSSINLDEAEQQLNKDHYGLKDVKERILEFIAVKKLQKTNQEGSILCFVGPPGVGKTSLGKSIASAMKRHFYRFSVGGMRDEAEIKGHRRTYIGAMPGKIIQGLKLKGTSNPVFMIDEIDKISHHYHGDPASAILEVLDPEQNYQFVDHYIDIPFDLSSILFITTANTLDTIPSMLLDRMEVIRLSGYVEEGKHHIAKDYLLPKQLKKHGLSNKNLKIYTSGYSEIIRYYARESGIRTLERMIEKICRKVATQIVRKKITAINITVTKISDYLGQPKFTDDVYKRKLQPGIAYGLAWNSLGGSVLMFEAIDIKEKGQLKITGQLGDVMSESANIAYSHIKKIAIHFGIDTNYFANHCLHLHVPSGATPKDGPSAGITMASALLSLCIKKTLPKKLAMTGELSLTGYVLAIGGIKEKLIAAKRNRFESIILPKENEKNVMEIDAHIKKGIKLHYVHHFSEVIQILFPDAIIKDKSSN